MDKKIQEFTGERCRRYKTTNQSDQAPILFHLDTEVIELSGYENSEVFVHGSVVARLIDRLFAKGLFDIEDLRAITGDETLQEVKCGGPDVDKAKPLTGNIDFLMSDSQPGVLEVEDGKIAGWRAT